jgi:dTDP-4-dehydrorhamnose reductase
LHLVHFSTDGVFNGSSGNYSESTRPDAEDLYGISKYLGEPTGENVLVIRTSMIGRALSPGDSLLDWFLRQRGTVRGYRRAIFTGLPVTEIANVLARHVLPLAIPLTGLFNLASAPISKFDLLLLLKHAWPDQEVTIEPSDDVVVDRSLCPDRLARATGYIAPAWSHLVAAMKNFYAALERR